MDQWEVSVHAVSRVGPDTVALELETPAGFTAQPGQFVLVRGTVDGADHARHYTISSPDVEGTFELTVGIDPEGAFSTWLADRSPGDVVTVEGPLGTVSYAGEGPVRVLAGGPGIGAGLGVAERASAAGFDLAIVADPEAADLIHDERFARLAREHEVYITPSATGFAAAVARAYAAVPAGTTYVFGFRDFAVRAREAIEAAGGDPAAAAVESYG